MTGAPERIEALRSPGERTAAVRAFLSAAREQVRLLHAGGAPGRDVVEEWTREVDGVLARLFGSLVREHGIAPHRVALFALGGYGRRELSPHSDLDLLIFHDDPAAIQGLAEGLLYPLWDAGIDVQCVARTVEENVAVLRADHRSRTSVIDARCLWEETGAADPLSRVFEKEVLWGEVFTQGVRGFVETKISEMEARHVRQGETVYLLEPNVKEGTGGLRDIQTALWVSMVRFKVRSIEELLQKGVIPSGEIRELELSRDFLLRIRNELHFSAGRRDDHLTFEAQDRIAPWLGFRDEGGIPGVERFLQEYYASANRVGHFATTVLRRACVGLLPRPASEKGPPRVVLPGVTLRGGELHIRPDAVEKAPLVLMEAFEAAQAHDADLSPEALELIRENLDRVDDRFRRDSRAVQSFLRILKSPRRVATTLMRMHDVRFLDRFIPEFGHIFCRTQRDMFHVYPVDVHSLFAVQELRRLARGEGEAEFPLLARLVREVRTPHVLYLAALLHDVGKGYGGGHEERGAEIAVAVADRMGLAPEDRERLVFLVRNHLLLAHTAQGRDLHDEELIFGFARRVGDLESLRMLYLLTFADCRAVGPGVWTSWKDLLFRELYEKAEAVLERGTFETEVAEDRVRDVERRLREEAAALTPPLPRAEVDVFLECSDGAPYLLANPVERLLAHLQAFQRRGDEPVAEVRHVPAESYSEVLLVTRDRPGLFSDVAGLMAAHRLNILSAVLNTRTDGWVLDVIHVCGSTGEVVSDERRWTSWSRDLSAVLGGSSTLESAVGSRIHRHEGLRRWKPRAPVRVRVDNEASRRYSILDITAGDRLGLLYDVARTLAARGLTIRLAKITTNLDQVSDSFYVEKVGQGKLTTPGEIDGLVAAIRAVLVGEALA